VPEIHSLEEALIAFAATIAIVSVYAKYACDCRFSPGRRGDRRGPLGAHP